MKKSNPLLSCIFFTLQILGSSVLLWAVFKAPYLPNLYKFIIGGVVILLAFFSTYLSLKVAGKKLTYGLKHAFVMLLAVTVCSIGILMTLLQGRVVGMQLEQPEEGQLLIDVLALNEKNFEDKNELLNGKIAVQTSFDQENQDYAITFINSDLMGELNIIEFSDFESALDALFAKEVDYVLMNETYISILSDEVKYEDLESQVKIVYQVKRIIAFDKVESDANVTKKAFNILVIGQNQKSKKVSDGTNTDVVLLVTINPVTKQVLMTSFPRDSYVPVPYSSMKDKLTHAGIYGASMTTKTIQNYIGIKVDFYIRVNYTSLINLVDVLGGISVDNPYTFKAVYPKYKYKFEKGPLELDGTKALAYVRERKTANGGDMGRNEHQRIVLDALVRKITSPSMMVNFSKILKTLEGCYLTNLSTDQIFSLVKMQLDDLAHWNILQQGLMGSTGGDYVASLYSYKKPKEENRKYSVVYVYPADLAEAKKNINKIINGEILTKDDVKLPSQKK